MLVLTFESSVTSSSSKTNAADFGSLYLFTYARPKAASSSGGIHAFSAFPSPFSDSFFGGGSTGSFNFLEASSPIIPERSDETKSTASPVAFAFSMAFACF